MIPPWSEEQIREDAETSRQEFRHHRLDEPLDKYLQAYDILCNSNTELIRNLGSVLCDPVDCSLLSEVVRDPNLRMALRYLAAPPISEDDLKTLIEDTLAWTSIRDNPEHAQKIRDVIAEVIDPKRFPWIREKRPATDKELDKAVMASTVVAASQRVQTERRSEGKRDLEGSVCSYLADCGFKKVTVGEIKNISRDAPDPGEFAINTVLGEDEADAVVVLRDHRIMAIECKVSNSELNSRKRINKEVAQNAQNWLGRFGKDQLVPSAVIQGVFKPEYLQAAQDLEVLFFWRHRLSDLGEFIDCAKP